jgi:hypothetical protein
VTTNHVRLVPFIEVELRLSALRCYWGGHMPAGDSHDIWLTYGGQAFVVPAIGRLRSCWEDDLEEIEGDLRAGRIGP